MPFDRREIARLFEQVRLAEVGDSFVVRSLDPCPTTTREFQGSERTSS